jgi:hypothetical protein
MVLNGFLFRVSMVLLAIIIYMFHGLLLSTQIPEYLSEMS